MLKAQKTELAHQQPEREVFPIERRHGVDAQIDLFAPPAPLPEREPSAIERALAAVNPDLLSPKEALDALYRLKTIGDGKAD